MHIFQSYERAVFVTSAETLLCIHATRPLLSLLKIPKQRYFSGKVAIYSISSKSSHRFSYCRATDVRTYKMKLIGAFLNLFVQKALKNRRYITGRSKPRGNYTHLTCHNTESCPHNIFVRSVWTSQHPSCPSTVLTNTDHALTQYSQTNTDHALTRYSHTPIMPWQVLTNTVVPWHSTHRQTPIITWHCTHKHRSCPDTVLTKTDYALTRYSQTLIMPWHGTHIHRSCPDTVLTNTYHALTHYSQTPIMPWHSTHKHLPCPDTVLTNTYHALTQYSQTSIMPWWHSTHRKSLPMNKSPPLGTNLNM